MNNEINLKVLATLYAKEGAKIRVWEVAVHEDSYFTRDYLEGGKVKNWVSRVCKPKNVGKKNATTAAQQAVAEAEALIVKKSKSGYYKTKEEAKNSFMFLPMLAHKWDAKRQKDVVYPIGSSKKLDGSRCFIHVENGVVVAKTRTNEMYKTVDHIIEVLKPILLANPNLILDGELYNHSYKDNFEDLMSVIRQQKPSAKDLEIARRDIEFHIYDCCILTDLNRSMEDRYKAILALPTLPNIKIVEMRLAYSYDDTVKFRDEYIDAGYEGQMLRVLSGSYAIDKRSPFLLKDKVFMDEEYKILDILPGEGAWAGKAKKVLVDLGDGATSECGIKGSFEFCAKILKEKDKYIGKLATVTHFGRTNHNSLRFGVVKDINRHD